MPSDWESKKVRLNDAIGTIPSGSHVYISNGATTPYILVEEMVELRYELVDMEIIQFINIGSAPYLDDTHSRFRTRTFFVDEKVYPSLKEGQSDYTPIAVSAIPQLVANRQIRIDVALIKVTPPNDQGMCNLGVGVDLTKEMIEHASLVIAEVSPEMPWTHGNSQIESEMIHYWIESEEPLISPDIEISSDEILNQIGQHLAAEIPDGATLRIGLGEISNAVLPFLKEKQHLGLHTEILTDGLMELIQEGVIDNTKKAFHEGKSIVTHGIGSPALYQFVDQNPTIEFHPLSYTNQWEIIGANHQLISIAAAYEIDLTGQVCAESRGHEFLGGFGGTLDFIRGAQRSPGGKSFMALRSTSLDEKSSNIVFALKPGAGVVVTRAEIDYVATEYGIAHLHGKNIRERCLALIEIAHPHFRDSLLNAAKHSHYISEKQPGYSFQHRYPSEWESSFDTKQGHPVLARPVKAIDEDKVRDFFHSLSDQSIYLRYFRPLRSLPHQILQGFVDIDYSKNMALIILNLESKQEEIVAMGQWIMDADGIPELAFQVSDDWQGQGLGTYLMHRLIHIAQTYHIPTLKADILVKNKSMLHVFESLDFPTKKTMEFGVKTFYLDLRL